VIHFSTRAEDGPCPFEGHVEHVASGETIRFRGEEELIAFLRHVLAKSFVGEDDD
jgi:hypothetical protein